MIIQWVLVIQVFSSGFLQDIKTFRYGSPITCELELEKKTLELAARFPTYDVRGDCHPEQVRKN